MTVLESLLVLVAGFAAGGINAVVGSGTLITFPTLLALGYPAVVANASNTIGLVPGGASAAFGYREELAGQRPRILRLGVAALLGGATGGVLLLSLPESAFEAIVPALIALALVLIVVQPRLTKAVAARRPVGARDVGPLLLIGIYLCGIYGGYFGAAQGVLMIAILGISLGDGLQRINALKNVLAGLVNGVAAVVFILLAEVAWEVVALIAGGSILGGYFGAGVARRLPTSVLRGFIIVVGIVAIVALRS